ncbi:hypothetical protein [Burkholderia pseudomallei]|uniref:hypothetical protein n=1 Tax=Burkholderia pseudomallei TaxID=28450 RepID=UPI003F685D3A
MWSRCDAARERETASLPFWQAQRAGAWPAGLAALRPARNAPPQHAPRAPRGDETGDTPAG